MQMNPFLPSVKRALDWSLPACDVRAKQSTAEMHVRTAIQPCRASKTGLLPDLSASLLGQVFAGTVGTGFACLDSIFFRCGLEELVYKRKIRVKFEVGFGDAASVTV